MGGRVWRSAAWLGMCCETAQIMQRLAMIEGAAYSARCLLVAWPVAAQLHCRHTTTAGPPTEWGHLRLL